jgi:CRP-like cAMP-binding protein
LIAGSAGTLSIMPPETPLGDAASAIASLRAGASAAVGETPLLPGWSVEDWRELLRFTIIRRVPAGDALIRRGEPDRTLHFVLRGSLEVMAHSGDGMSLGPLAQIGAGSVLGELSFFDGGPRSAGAWAVEDCDVASLAPDRYAAFEAANPRLARDLLFALGRILSLRLRRTTARAVV